MSAEVWRKQSDNSQIYGFWYSYDGAHNRLQMRRESTVGVEFESAYYSYAADNSLTKRGVQVPPSTRVDTYYYYDANGALTSFVEDSAATYFAYGPQQLVTAVRPASGNPWYFYYDGKLDRYAIDKGGTTAYYCWDGLNQLEERDASGNLVARYTHGNYRQYGIGSVVEVERHVGAATYYQYPLCDHRGTVYAMVDANQNTQLTYTMDAFGRQLAGIGGALPTVPNDLIYQSNWLTLSIGGRWYGVSRYRLYDPELGIFLSRDFLRYLNKYRAFSNRPVNTVDNNGLEEVSPGPDLVNEILEEGKRKRGIPTGPQQPSPGKSAPIEPNPATEGGFPPVEGPTGKSGSRGAAKGEIKHDWCIEGFGPIEEDWMEKLYRKSGEDLAKKTLSNLQREVEAAHNEQRDVDFSKLFDKLLKDTQKESGDLAMDIGERLIDEKTRKIIVSTGGTVGVIGKAAKEIIVDKKLPNFNFKVPLPKGLPEVRVDTGAKTSQGEKSVRVDIQVFKFKPANSKVEIKLKYDIDFERDGFQIGTPIEHKAFLEFKLFKWGGQINESEGIAP